MIWVLILLRVERWQLERTALLNFALCRFISSSLHSPFVAVAMDEGVLALMRHAPPCFSLLHPLLSRGLSQDNTSRWMVLPSKSRLVSFYAAKKIPRDK